MRLPSALFLLSLSYRMKMKTKKKKLNSFNSVQEAIYAADDIGTGKLSKKAVKDKCVQLMNFLAEQECKIRELDYPYFPY